MRHPSSDKEHGMAASKRDMEVERIETMRMADFSLHSWRNFEAPLRAAAKLVVATFDEEATVLGAFQRTSEISCERKADARIVRRCSGGAAVRVGRGTLYVALALPSASALVPCEPSRILNRYVRPLLKGLARMGAGASYFDRDWISVGHRPVAQVGFAHDALTGHAVVEAFVCVRGSFSDRRPSFLGKDPGSLESVVGRAFDLARLGDSIEAAYETAFDVTIDRTRGWIAREETLSPSDAGGVLCDDLPWQATIDEAIGIVAAGHDMAGHMRIGGELMVSRDAIARLEVRLDALGTQANVSNDDVAEIVCAELAAPGVALAGVRDLASIVDVVVRARMSRVSRDGSQTR
jgi:hypothetical protein